MQRGHKVMERKNLFEEQKEYQALLQSVTDCVIAVNRNYQIIMANDLFINKLGGHSEGFCYKAWKNRDDKCDDCLVEKSFRDGLVHQNEEAIVLKDGRIAQMLIKSTPVKDDQGKIVYVLEAATDITEKKRLQQELKSVKGNLEKIIDARLNHLQKSEEKYRTIFERSRDALILADSNGKIMEINRAGVEILGYRNKEDLLGLTSVKELFKDPEEFYQFQKQAFGEGVVTEFEVRLVGGKRGSFDALVTSNVILDLIGRIIGDVIIIRDITKRKKAQQQIEMRNTRLAILNAISMTISNSLDLNEVLNSTIDKIRELLESDSVRIYLLDGKRNVLNLAAHKGLSSEFISKSHIRHREVGTGFLGQAVLACETRVVDNIEAFEDSYADLMVKEGLHSTAYIPLVSKGQPLGVMVVSSYSGFKFSANYVDFLTAIGNQIGVAVDNANLYENVKRAYQELKEAQEQVIRTEKLASLGKLAATVAHEINNPLAAVLTYTRLMMKLMSRGRFTQERLEDIARYLTIMESETSRCGEIVKNLLAFSRQPKITMETSSIEEVIEKTMPLISHDLEMKNIQLVKEIEPDLPKIKCSSRHIQQALLNLLSNASEAMTEGGILTVTVKRSKSDGFVEVVISDTGCGISEEDLKNIFEPFFTTKEEGRGVGLGLSVVHGIITRHNGSIEIKSKPDEGSTFKVRLPTVR
jgi:PAS domain S-box-containing protein